MQTSEERHIAHYFTDHAKSALVVAFVSLAVGFSGKTFGPSAVWICMGLACVIVLSLGHDYSSAKGSSFKSTLKWCAPICLALLAFGWWLAQPKLLPIVWADDSDFNFVQRYRVQLELTKFHDYLHGVGFQLPDQLPVIQQSTDETIAGAVGAIGRASNWPSSWSVEVGGKNMLEGALIGYAQLVFRELLLHPNGNILKQSDVSDFGFRMIFTSDLADYFVHSYSPATYLGVSSRGDAFWAIRQRFQQVFTDNALYNAVQTLNASPLNAPIAEHFDNEVQKLFLRGASVMDPNQHHRVGIERIFRAHPTRWVIQGVPPK